MLRPLLEKPDALYFGIKGQVKIFAPRISFFLSNMLEADEITVTYKSSRCKMPYHTCMVPQNDLNNINLRSEELSLRTHDYMRQIITEERERNFLFIPPKTFSENLCKYYYLNYFENN